jgi:hypothetical protein
MDPARRTAVAVAIPLALAACATVRQITALRQVDFSIDRVAGVRVAGVALDRVRSFNDLDLRDAGRLAGAAARGEVPLVMTVHLRGENPEDNPVTARLVRMTWTLTLNGRETVSGALDTAYTFPPGQPQDVVVPVQLDLYRFFQSSARDAFELARGLLGLGAATTEVALRAVPIIDTPLGAIRYPGPITIVRRRVGGP